MRQCFNKTDNHAKSKANLGPLREAVKLKLPEPSD